MIDRLINTGLNYDATTTHDNADEIIQCEIIIEPDENDDSSDRRDEEQNNDDDVEEVEEENADVCPDPKSNVDANDTNDIVGVEHRSNEEIQATDSANEEGVTISRSGSVSRPHDFISNCNGTCVFYQDNADENQNDELDVESEHITWIKPYYYYEIDMIGKLGGSDFYQNSHFVEDVVEKTLTQLSMHRNQNDRMTITNVNHFSKQ